jgi:hypothetical protein
MPCIVLRQDKGESHSRLPITKKHIITPEVLNSLVAHVDVGFDNERRSSSPAMLVLTSLVHVLVKPDSRGEGSGFEEGRGHPSL